MWDKYISSIKKVDGENSIWEVEIDGEGKQFIHIPIEILYDPDSREVVVRTQYDNQEDIRVSVYADEEPHECAYPYEINIAKDFTKWPRNVFRKNGPKSGQEFYEDILLPKFNRAVKDGHKLTVYTDDTNGFTKGFITESFGRLGYERDKYTIWSTVEIVSQESRERKNLIESAFDDYDGDDTMQEYEEEYY